MMFPHIFVLMCREGKAQLQLAGAADPTGRGFGYSFVRDIRHKVRCPAVSCFGLSPEPLVLIVRMHANAKVLKSYECFCCSTPIPMMSPNRWPSGRQARFRARMRTCAV
jgi:hypothetical protein